MGVLAGTTAHADEQGLLNDAFYVELGAYRFSASTELRIDGSAGMSGTSVDWERELGLSDKNTFRIDSFWRFSPKHKIRAMYFSNTRGGEKALTRDIVVGDETFPVDAVIRSTNETRILELAYEYAFVRRDSYEVSATAGLHLTELGAGLSVTGSVNGANVDVGQSSNARLRAPLPVLGLRGLWQLSETIYVDAHAQYFYIAFDGLEGAILDYRAAITWQPGTWFGLGLGFNEFSTKLSVDRSRFDGHMEWTYNGPQLFVAATF